MTTLTLRKTTFARAESSGEIYEVVGLPGGHEVFIRQTEGKWKVIRMENGVRQSWAEGYETLDDAFATVRESEPGPRS